MENNKERETKFNYIIILIIILFFYNGFNFLNTQGSGHPLVSPLFNMIEALAILFFIFHKNEIMKEQKNGQTYLEKYFSKKKKD